MSDTEVVVEPITSENGVTTVTSQNLQRYTDEKLGIKRPTPEEQAAAELNAIEAAKAAEEAAKKAAEEDVTHDVPEVPKDKKGKLNERFKELTDKRKEAEAKLQAEADRAAKFEAEAKALKEERERLAQEAEELRKKYEPPKPVYEEEPKPEQFSDINEYSKAVKDWTAEQTRKEIAAQTEKTQREEAEKRRVSSYQERAAVFEAETPDFKEAIDGTKIMLPNEILAEILDSEVGPQVAYHLAKNEVEAEALAKLPLSKAIKEIGKLEARFSVESKPQKKDETKPVSKAPAPISPLTGGVSTGSSMMDSKGEFVGTYEDWKRLRSEGKIK